MDEALFNTHEIFDDDYLYFYETFLTPERARADVELIERVLELTPGMRVLDLGCGHGRIANRLAERGYHVVGIDESKPFLARAREEAPADANGSVEYVQADMRDFDITGPFDAVVSWFTSFGYFSDADNRRVLDEAFSMLGSGGKLLIEQPNRDNLIGQLRRLQTMAIEHPQQPADVLIDRVTYDVNTGRTNTTRTIIRDGAHRKTEFSVRMFPFVELKQWLEQAGFTTVEGYGADGKPLRLDSGRMIAVAIRS